MQITSIEKFTALLNSVVHTDNSIFFSQGIEARSDGNECAAIIYDQNGVDVCDPDDSLILTPVSQKDATSNTSVKARLERAYERIHSVSHLSELSSNLESCAKEYSLEINVDYLVIRDLFDISVISKYFEENTNSAIIKLVVTLKLSIDALCLEAILFSEDCETWKQFTRLFS